MKEVSHTLERRQLLRGAALLLGICAVPGEVMSAVLSGAPGGGQNALSTALTPSQFQLVSKLSDLIIPPSDTPGASGAGVPVFIDALLVDYFSPEHREQFFRGLQAVDELARQYEFSGFLEADDETQLLIAKTLNTDAYAAQAESARGLFFKLLKEMVMIGYYTSEVGATEELAYEMIPGGYDGCLPLTTGGRAWATNGFPISRINVATWKDRA